jgi:hypothetical protein
MAALTPDQAREAELLVKRLQDDDVQDKLRPGFEQDFTNSILEQWNERQWLSFEGRNGKRSQIEIIRELIERAEQRGSSLPSRRWGARG